MQPISKIPTHQTQSRTTAVEPTRERNHTGAAGAPRAQVVYQAGDVVGGKYQLSSLLGQGGMGAVWRAKNMDLDAEVAIKLIASSASSEGADRLLREAQAAAKLDDPAILRVFDFGKSERGEPFIVMELLNGEDLGAAIQSRGRLSPKRAVRVLLPIVRALTLAHENGIVHRDLKPENVFLAKTKAGLQPKVVDFGIAQLDKSRDVRLTTTGALMGSPLYMSPEQAKGEAVDHRADIWSLSVMLYEALTGKVPFAGPNYNAVLCAVMVKEPERPTDEPLVDDELWSILQRGMHKDPSFRFQSMRELGKLLAGWLLDCGEHEDITGASLSAQWQQSLAPVDQLTTVFPPDAPDNKGPSDQQKATQRISRPTASKPEARSQPARGRSKLYAAGALLGLLVIGGVAFGLLSKGSAETARATSPENTESRQAPPRIKATTANVELAAAKPATPVTSDPKAVAEPKASEAPSAEEPAATPETPRKPAARASVRRAAKAPSSKRTAKLKNPFAR